MSVRTVDPVTQEIVGNALTLRQILERLKSGSLRGIKSKLFYMIDDVLEYHVVHSRAVHRLPRWVLYNLVRGAVYFEYLMQKVILKVIGRQFNLFSERIPVRRLDVDPAATLVQKTSSLRSVVKDRDSKVSRRKTLSEINQDVLAIGL